MERKEMLICVGVLVLCALLTIGWALHIWLGRKNEKTAEETEAAEETEQDAGKSPSED